MQLSQAKLALEVRDYEGVIASTSEAELRGQTLFFGEVQGVTCHTPPDHTDNSMHTEESRFRSLLFARLSPHHGTTLSWQTDRLLLPPRDLLRGRQKLCSIYGLNSPDHYHSVVSRSFSDRWLWIRLSLARPPRNDSHHHSDLVVARALVSGTARASRMWAAFYPASPRTRCGGRFVRNSWAVGAQESPAL